MAHNVITQFQFSISVYSHCYKIFIYIIYSRVIIEKKRKKEITGKSFVRSVRWSEELSFRANHRYECKCIKCAVGAMVTMDD